MNRDAQVSETNPQFEDLLEYIRERRLFDFRGYKRTSLMRRVLKRMQEVKIGSFDEYRDHLEVDPEEFTPLFNTILINVTGFFRDPGAWQFLAEHAVPEIVREKKAGDPIRVWSAGCASGEEPYTLAMVFAEILGADAFRQRVKIYGTDVDEEALDQARHASYDSRALESVPSDLWGKYFEKVETRHVFRPDLRRQMIFGRHDLIQDAPISHLDLLVCRNTLMYFDAETQGKILARFHFALKNTAFLFVGRAEMLLTRASLFSPVDIKSRVFKKALSHAPRERATVLAEGMEDIADRAAQLTRLRDIALEATPLAELVIDANGTLLLANEKARTLFSISERDVGCPFRDLEVSYRPIELRSLIEQAYAERRTVRLAGAERRFPGGELQFLDVQVIPLWSNDTSPLGASIVFTDVTSFTQLKEELQKAHQERETAFEELQSANEELETTNEELQSTNEELETTNEELQSTNEEMETMNEELQSTNEELQTMNDELRIRTEELNRTNNFTRSIFQSLNLGIAVLDRDLKVTVWNSKAEDLWGCRAGEVEGQAFLSLDIGLPVKELASSIGALMAGEETSCGQTLTALNRRGKTIRCRVSCSRLTDDAHEAAGVILLMEEGKGGLGEQTKEEREGVSRGRRTKSG